MEPTISIPYIYYTKMVFGQYGKEGMYAIREARTHWKEYGQDDIGYAKITGLESHPIVEEEIGNDNLGYSLNQLQGFNITAEISNSSKPLVYSETLCEIVIGNEKILFLEPILTWGENAVFRKGSSDISLDLPSENYISFRSQNVISSNRIGNKANYNINCRLVSTYHKDKLLVSSDDIELVLKNEKDAILIKNNYDEPIEEVKVKCLTPVKYSDNYVTKTQTFIFENNMVLPVGRHKTIKSNQ